MSAALQQSLVELVGSVLVLVASIWVLPWLRSRKQQAGTAAERDAYMAAHEIIEAAVQPAVAAVEQTTSRRLRSSADASTTGTTGHRLSDEQAVQAFSAALEATFDALGSNGRVSRLCKALGVDEVGLRKIVRTRIEAALLDLKLRAPSSSAATRVDGVLLPGEAANPAGDSGEILPPGE